MWMVRGRMRGILDGAVVNVATWNGKEKFDVPKYPIHSDAVSVADRAVDKIKLVTRQPDPEWLVSDFPIRRVVRRICQRKFRNW